MADTATTLRRAADFLVAIPGAAEKASAAALSRAAAAGREKAIALILDRYSAKASDVRAAVTTTKARPENLVAEVVARSGSLPLDYFPHSPKEIGTGGRSKPPLRVEVLRGSVRDVPGAFVAPINGRNRIMLRTGGTTKTGRLQIRTVPAVPIAVMMNNQGIRDAVENRASEVLEQRLADEIDRELAGVG